MPYVKLDCGMVDSTIWVEREAREIFITALLMAEPREFKEPVPQIRVRSIEPTGFMAPAGWYGFVDAAGPGIARRAIMDYEEGLRALEALGEPDPESRSSDFEGRRMIRIDGGYLILNYMKYREKDHTAAERAQRYRQRKKEESSRRDVTPSPRNITQAEAKAEALKAKDMAVTPPTDASASASSACPISKIVALYHDKLPMLPRVRKLTRLREGHIKQRWREDMTDLEDWELYFSRVADSAFLTGRSNATNGRPPFRADLDWLARPENFAKVIEGRYDG